MNLSSYTTKTYGNKSRLLTMAKQTQNKPNQTQFMVSRVEPPVVSLPALSLSKCRTYFTATLFGGNLSKIH
jgi:hypothetical protein